MRVKTLNYSLSLQVANIKRYIEKNKVPSVDYIAVYKKGAINEEDVKNIEQFELWLNSQTLKLKTNILASFGPSELLSYL